MGSGFSALNESESTHVVTSQDMLPKLIKASSRIKSVTHIIYMENQASKTTAPKVDGINLIPYSKLYELGKNNLKVRPSSESAVPRQRMNFFSVESQVS